MGLQTLATVNMRCKTDKEKNLQKYSKFIEEAAGKGVDFLVLPDVYEFIADRSIYYPPTHHKK